ncbi:ZNT4 protein, partial [Polyodon spathula]|nr:ZNT4 protein [Polyodon spathula]
MSRGNLWTTFKSVLRTPNDGPLDLDDATSFDFSGEVLDEELPKFNQLRVVVSDEMSDSSPGIPHAASAVNGRRIHSAVSEDDSILGSSSSLQNQGIQLDQSVIALATAWSSPVSASVALSCSLFAKLALVEHQYGHGV